MKGTMAVSRVRRRVFQHVFWARGLIILAFLIFFLLGLRVLVPLGRKTLGSMAAGYHFLYKFAAGPSTLAQADGRTNFLILGVGGIGHDGLNLTDLMIFVSYNQINGRVVIVSIPRDLWIDELGAKINTAFQTGEAKQPGGGLVLAKSMVEEVVGQKIQYALVVDFRVFEGIVGAVGGVNVCVDRAFDDFKYPIAGKENAEPESERYEHLHFDAGCQQMNGGTALRFVRSRYAEGAEGSDFARSRRQQKVVLAIKEKIATWSNLLDTRLVKKLVEIFSQDVVSDVPKEDAPSLIRMGLGLNSKQMVLGQLDTDDPEASHSGLLANPPIGPDFDYQWVLIPKAGRGNWSEVRGYVSYLLSSPADQVEFVYPKDTPKVDGNP